jgi:16S rRNA (adenine1518-N6/adenine1519-N6)-dimethyltransferase
MLVMVQKEVAERMAASPGSKQFGAMTVKVAYWAQATLAATVPASVFVPRPNVESALVRIDRRPPPDVDPSLLFPLVRQAFGQRRKMLRKSLRDIVSAEQFERAGISPEARPEELGLDEWCRLAGACA